MSDETSTTTSSAPEPVTSATPAPQPGDSTSTTPAPDASATPETQETRPDAQDEADKHTLPKGVQKRIDRLTRDKYRLQAELDVARKQAPQSEAKPQPPSSGEPKADQFKSYEEYLEARAEWKAEQRVEKRLGELRDNAQRQAGQAEQEKLQTQWEKRVSEALTTYDDFEEVALSPEVPISEPMMAAILRSPKGADVAYHLGKNHDLAAQIAALDPIGAAIRIGELAASLTRPTPKKTTGAPPPISPVGGRATTSNDPSQMSDAEFAKWRREQIRRRA